MNYYIIYLLCFSTYYFLNKTTEKLLENKIHHLSKSRRFYIGKNITKSIILILLTLYAFPTIYKCIFENYWDNRQIHIIGILYTSHDILSLYLAYNKLPSTTRMHHISVSFLSIINLFNNYNNPIIWKGLVIYAFFSANAFYVNTFLGSRFILNKKINYYFSKISCILYILNCILNWSYQSLAIYQYYSYNYISTFIFSFLISFLVYDDLVLIKFLYDYK